MALSYQQAVKALKAADAAGNVEDARKLAKIAARLKLVDKPDAMTNEEAVNAIPGNDVQIPRKQPATLADKAIGAGETALSMITGATGGAAGFTVGGLEGIGDAINAGQFGTQEGVRMAEDRAIERSGQLTYAPRTEEGQRQTGALGEAIGEFVPPVLPVLGPEGAVLSGLRGVVPAVEKAAGPVVNAVTRAADKLAPEPLGRTSAGGAATPLEMQRTATAGSLPKPIKLTLGEVTRNADQLAFEKEQLKSQLGGPLRNRAEENNLSVLQNFEALIDSTDSMEPDLASAGNKVIKSLSLGWKNAKKQTKAAYDQANNSKEALIEIDSAPLAEYLNSRPTGLATTPVTDHIKKYAEILGIVKKGKDDLYTPLNTNVKTMEQLYKEINKVAKFDPDKQMEASVPKTIINSLTDAVAGPLYRKAKDTRIKQAWKYENRAVVARLLTNIKGMDDPKVAASEVFNKAILNSTPEEITFLKRVIQTSGKDGVQAWKEMQGAAAKYIRDQATAGMQTDSAGNPMVSPAKLHQTIKQLDKNGRLDLMFGKQRSEKIRDLDEVMGYINTVPPGTLINNSGTSAALMTALSEMAATGLLTGVPIALITPLKMLRDAVKNNRIRAKIDKALEGLPSDKVTNIRKKP